MNPHAATNTAPTNTLAATLRRALADNREVCITHIDGWAVYGVVTKANAERTHFVERGGVARMWLLTNIIEVKVLGTATGTAARQARRHRDERWGGR